jgi:RsmE family RNA methyltransferase
VNVILIAEDELAPDGRATLSDARATHLREVLRSAVGATVRVGVIDGALGTARVESIDDQRAVLACTWGEAPPRPRVDVLLALPRPKALGRLYSPLAQLGVGHLMLSHAARVERYYFDAHQLEPAYQRAQLLEGLAQARDTHLPTVTVHRSVRALIEDDLPRDGALRLLADPGATTAIAERARSFPPGARVLIAIGPEGGWNDFERALLAAHGFAPVGLGPRTLRTDVATIALLALVHDALGPR